MEALQNYLFENAQDFHDKHYINLMRLLLIAHVEIKKNIVVPIPVDLRVPIPVQPSERIVRITEHTWAIVLKDIVDGFNYDNQDINLIPARLKSIVSGSWVPTRFVFPSSLTIEQRQKLHISRSRSVYECDSYTMEGCLNYLIY